MHSFAALFLLAASAISPAREDAPLRVYVNADLTYNTASGSSIELGTRTALGQLHGKLGGREVELVVLDHRANGRRSSRNMARVAADPDALAVIGGMHSPPLLAERSYIHEHELLVLVPWAAAGPITRFGGEPNWIFRLSVDDTKAGEVLAGHAVDSLGSTQPHLILERTGWGKSNETTILAALERRGHLHPKVHWVDWGIGQVHAEQLARETVTAGADAILLVANSGESRTLIEALNSVGSDAAIVSHWGVIGGALDGLIPKRREGRLSVLKTRAVSALQRPNDVARRATQFARKNFPRLLVEGDVPRACGFVHAHDLVLLLDAAVRQAGPCASSAELRRATRAALENLERPVAGALKTYEKPFAPWTAEEPDAHEALGASDLGMYLISADGEIVERCSSRSSDD